MGLFSRIKNALSNFTQPKPANVPRDILDAFQPAQERQSIFTRAVQGLRNLFGIKREPSPRPQTPETLTPQTSKTLTPQAPELSERMRDFVESRRFKIFQYRRRSGDIEYENAFYRLTQNIWDVPDENGDVPDAKMRDEAIQKYFTEKYGISDMEEIYNFVINKHSDVIKKYNDAPEAGKYNVIMNIAVPQW